MEARIFVEWYDPERPHWGGYVNSLDPAFGRAFREMEAEFGAPTKVEYRAEGEGQGGEIDTLNRLP
jgi:hypothetical protein